MSRGLSENIKKFHILLLREIRNLIRFPYLELILFVFIFQVMSINGIFFTFAIDLDEIKLYASHKYFSYIAGQIPGSYLVVSFFACLLSYLSVSYMQDISFFKTEFSFPIGKGIVYLTKFLSSFLILLPSISASVFISAFFRNLGAIQFIPLSELTLYSLMVFIEAISTAFLVTSIAILLAFIVKRSGVSFILTFSLLYFLQLVSPHLGESIPLLPYSLGDFEKLFLESIMRETFDPLVFRPLIPSLLLSLLLLSFGYYYVTRRMQIC